jgi:hypothetical protein
MHTESIATPLAPTAVRDKAVRLFEAAIRR